MPRSGLSLFKALAAACLVSAVVCSAARGATPESADSRLAAAEKFVAKSGRYMHHSRLRRGMKGYGLTVLTGTKVVRFDAEIVSVVTRWGPHQDMILAKLSGQNLEKTMIISGMSGSPVYMKDPKDGKFKMVGAVAYGWRGSKEPLCGLQPITQMLALAGAMPGDKPAKGEKTAWGGSARPAGASGELPAAFLGAEKIDFSRLRAPVGPGAVPAGALQLRPLRTPLMISGVSRKTLARAAEMLRPLGMMPVQAGGVNADVSEAAKNAKFEPGGVFVVPVVTGDSNWSAVGTATDVVGDKVLALGHSFHAEGQTNLPIAPGYVHTVVSGLFSSFKMGTDLGISGALVRDEYTGVLGRIGPKAVMIPMTVSVNWKDDRRKLTCRYNICRHKYLTNMLVSMVLFEAVWGWRELPERHHVGYSVDVDFGKLGKYHAENISNGMDIYWPSSDMGRAVSAMLWNPYGPPAPIKSISVAMTITAGDVGGEIIDFRLDRDTWRPGETVTGRVTLRRFRKPRTTLPLKFELPEGLPEGKYTLSASNWSAAISATQREQPHKFAARTPADLLAGIQRTVGPRADVLYVRLPLPESGGLALDKKELPDLPPSKAAVISQARLIDTRAFRRTLVREIKTDYVLTGSAGADLEVTKHRRETPVSK